MFSYLFFSMFTKENALAIQEGKGLSNARGSRRDPPACHISCSFTASLGKELKPFLPKSHTIPPKDPLNAASQASLHSA